MAHAIDVVEHRLAAEAEKSGGATDADPHTGEAWERGQVWGHIAEFVPFWTEQVGDVIDEYQGEPIVIWADPRGRRAKGGDRRRVSRYRLQRSGKR